MVLDIVEVCQTNQKTNKLFPFNCFSCAQTKCRNGLFAMGVLYMFQRFLITVILLFFLELIPAHYGSSIRKSCKTWHWVQDKRGLHLLLLSSWRSSFSKFWKHLIDREQMVLEIVEACHTNKKTIKRFPFNSFSCAQTKYQNGLFAMGVL